MMAGVMGFTFAKGSRPVVGSEVASEFAAADEAVSDSEATEETVADRMTMDEAVSDSMMTDKAVSEREATDEVVPDGSAEDSVSERVTAEGEAAEEPGTESVAVNGEAAEDSVSESLKAEKEATEDTAAKNFESEYVAGEEVNSEYTGIESDRMEDVDEDLEDESEKEEPSGIGIGLQVDEVTIDLPGVENSYELLFVSDMHILTVDESVYEDHIPVAQNRYENMFRSSTGTYSKDTWKALSSVIDDWQADALIMGGDMMDFVSPGNVALFQEGLNQISTPYMYLRADHDLGTWYSASLTEEDALELHRGICSYEDMYVMEFQDFYVLGWNNSTGQLTEAGLATAQDIWDDGKPIILVTHVPINSIVDNGLAETAANIDPQGRVKLWGYDCLYQPGEYTTATFLEMLYDAQSPVEAVLSGHLHFKYTVPLTEQTMEYVFAPAFAGNIAKIEVH